jgi:hypothetical protein
MERGKVNLEGMHMQAFGVMRMQGMLLGFVGAM